MYSSGRGVECLAIDHHLLLLVLPQLTAHARAARRVTTATRDETAPLDCLITSQSFLQLNKYNSF